MINNLIIPDDNINVHVEIGKRAASSLSKGSHFRWACLVCYSKENILMAG